MSLHIVHILDSPDARAGQIHAHLPGLVEALGTLDVDCDVVVARPGDPLTRPTHGGPSTAMNDLLDRADILHVHGVAALTHPEVKARLHHAGHRMLIAPHGDLLPSPWRRRGPLTKVLDWISGTRRRYGRAAALIGATPAEIEHLRGAHLNDRVEHLTATATAPLDTPGIDALTTIVPEAAGKRCLLYLGVLDPVEGLVPMLKACEQVVLAAPEWHLIIAGHQHGRWLGMIRAAVERRRMTNRVSFVVDPTIAQQDLLLRQCEVVCQPSLLDVTPFSGLAGMLYGKPCVVSERCQWSEFDPACGWQVRPQREALAEALMTVVSLDAAVLCKMGTAGRAWAASRTWASFAPRYKELYASVAR